MKIDEALIIFYNLKNNNKDKSIIEICENFISILLDLQKRDFTSNQKKELEAKLLTLKLNNIINLNKKDLNKRLTLLESFLTHKFAIITENYYVSKGMALWLFSSIILFYTFGQFSVIGALLVTIIFGIVLDTQAKVQGRVIQLKNDQNETFSIQKPIKLDNLSEVENQERIHKNELQLYRKKKLQQFGKVNTPKENVKKHQI